MEGKMWCSCTEPSHKEECPFRCYMDMGEDEDISYVGQETRRTHKIPLVWWRCLNSIHTEQTGLYDPEYSCQLMQRQEKYGGCCETAEVSNKGYPSTPDGTESSKAKRRKKRFSTYYGRIRHGRGEKRGQRCHAA
ncbi:hypothetical protein FKM82_025097 [Ascaphus truei]